jgi:hypothetical protein
MVAVCGSSAVFDGGVMRVFRVLVPGEGGMIEDERERRKRTKEWRNKE